MHRYLGDHLLGFQHLGCIYFSSLQSFSFGPLNLLRSNVVCGKLRWLHNEDYKCSNVVCILRKLSQVTKLLHPYYTQSTTHKWKEWRDSSCMHALYGAGISIYITPIHLKGKLSISTCSKITYTIQVAYNYWNIYTTTPLDKIMSQVRNQLVYNIVSKL